MDEKTRKRLSAQLCMLIDDRNVDEDISEAIDSLIKKGADVNFQDLNFNGDTPLHIAIAKKDIKCVEFLLTFNPKTETKNDDDETALDIAIKCDNQDILSKLSKVKIESSEVIEPKFIFELDVNDNSAESDNFEIDSNIRILRLINCVDIDNVLDFFLTKTFQDLIIHSTHLFAIDVNLKEPTSATEFKEKAETILQYGRPWIIELHCDNKPTIIYKESSSSLKCVQVMAKMEANSFISELRNECSFQNLMQGFYSNLIGIHDGSIFNAKLTRNELQPLTVAIAAEHSSLCLRFLKLFDEESYESLLFSTIKNDGIENLLAFLDLPLNSENQNFSLTDHQTRILMKTDDHGSNILQKAIESNNAKAVKFLLQFQFELTHRSIAFCDLAWNLKHYKCLKELLIADSPFPIGFDPVHTSLDDFIENSIQFHGNIKAGSMEKVENFVKANPGIKCAYSTSNTSALTIALDSKQFEIYAYLKSQGFSKGIDDEFDCILENLTRPEKEIIRQENNKFFESSENSHLFHILSKTRIAFNPEDSESNFQVFNEMLSELDDIQEIRPILKAVEHSDELKIVFDFNKRGVKDMIPSKGYSELGTCDYEKGHVYVGAKNYEDRYFNILGVFIHELSHYVIDLIYGNESKPYFPTDYERRQTYQKIVSDVRALESNSIDPVISNIFKAYKEKDWEKELIVRVPQLLALYSDELNLKELERVKSNSSDLFNFFFDLTLKDIENISELIKPKQKIKELNTLMGSLMELWKSKFYFKANKYNVDVINEIRVIGSNAPTFSMVMIFETFYNLHKDACKFHAIFANLESLNIDVLERTRDALNSTVKPNLIINGANSLMSSKEKLLTFLEQNNLSERIIVVLTENEALEMQETFQKAHFELFTHTWEDLEEDSHSFLLNKKVNFQGYNVKLCDIISRTSKALNEIQLQEIADENPMEIGEPLERFDNDFLIPRKFLQNIAKDGLQENIWIEKSCEELLKEGEKLKKVLIADMAGTGKTIILGHIAETLKDKHPDFWVSIIELRLYTDHLKEVEDSDISLSFQDFILQVFYKELNQFDRRVFAELHDAGRAIILLDGFDEISPHFKEPVMSFIKSFKINGGNQLFITTRSHLQAELESVFNTTAFRLQILSKEDQIQFLMRSWSETEENPDTRHVAEDLINRLQKLTSSDTGFIGFPILIRMIAEIYKDQKLEPDDDFSYYSIYQKFTERIFTLWRDRREASRIDHTELDMQTGVRGVMDVHQKLAIDHIFGDEFEDLEEELEEDEWSSEMISRVGIVKKIKSSYQFIHETFAEYFVARYVTAFMCNKRKYKKVVDIFLKIAAEKDSQITRAFLNESFGKISFDEKTHENIREMLMTKIKKSQVQGYLINIIEEGHKVLFDFLCLHSFEKTLLIKILTESKKNKKSRDILRLRSKLLELSYEPRFDGTNLYDEMKSTYGEEWVQKFQSSYIGKLDEVNLRTLLDFQASDGNSCVQVAFKLANRTFMQSIIKILRVFDISELKLLFQKSSETQSNIFHCLAENYNEGIFEEVTEFLESVFEKNEIRELLLENSSKKYNIFQHSIDSYRLTDSSNFYRMHRLLKKYLSSDEIKTLLLEKNDYNNDCLLIAVSSGDKFVIDAVFHVMGEVISKEERIEILKSGNIHGDTLFHSVSANNSYKGTFKLLTTHLAQVLTKDEIKELLRKKNYPLGGNFMQCIAEIHLTDDLKDIFEVLKNYLTKNEIRLMFEEKVLGRQDCLGSCITLRKKRLFDAFCDRLPEVFDNNERKEIFRQQDAGIGNNLFHTEAFLYDGGDFFQVICKRLSEVLSKNEIRELLMQENFFGATMMFNVIAVKSEIMNRFDELREYLSVKDLKQLLLADLKKTCNMAHTAVNIRKKRDVEQFYGIAKKLLDPEEFRQLFLGIDIKGRSVFHHAAGNERENKIFHVLLDLMRKDFEKIELKSLLLQGSDSLSMLLNSAIVRKSDATAFDDIFSTLKELLTSDELKELAIAEMNGMMKCVHLVVGKRGNEVVETFFTFLKTISNMGNLGILIRSKAAGGKNIFHSAVENIENEDVIIAVLRCIKDLVDDAEIKEMIQCKTDENFNLLHLFMNNCNNRQFDSIFATMNDFLTKEEIENLLYEPNPMGLNFLHLGLLRLKINYSSLVTNLKKFFSNEEILKLFKSKAYGIHSIFTLAAFSNMPTIFTDLLKHFEDLIGETRAKTEVLEMFQYRIETGENVFLILLSVGNLESVFDNFCSVLAKIADSQESKQILQEKSSTSRNVFGCFASNVKINLKLLKLWSFLSEFIGTEELFELLSAKDILDGDNSLHIAIASGNEKFIEDLFEIFSSDNRNDEVCLSLIRSSDKHQNNLFHSACVSKTKNYQTIVKNLKKFISLENIREMFLEPNIKGFNPFQQLARWRDSEKLVELCEVLIQIFDENELENFLLSKASDQQNILHIAAKENKDRTFVEAFVELFMKHVRNPLEKFQELLSGHDSEGNTPLNVASAHDNEEIRLFLTKHFT